MIEVLDHSQLAERLHEHKIRVVYTDLDGTMFAPGGTISTDDSGNPSSRVSQLLVELKDADIELVICTGRNRAQTTEISRVLGVHTFIGELGGFYQRGFGPKSFFQFNTGQWSSLPDGKTPLEVIHELGIIDRLAEIFPGCVEEVEFDITSRREVTALFLGRVDAEKAEAQASTADFPISIIDNGVRAFPSKKIKMTGDVHIYHVLPRGISKGEAIRIDQQLRGISPNECLALGDSVADLSMASACGLFGLTANGCAAEEVQAHVEKNRLDVLGTGGKTTDGWCEFIEALLA